MPSALTRSITLLHATALVAGTIIGASIFVQPSAIVEAVPSVRAVYLVWIVAGILTLFGALIAAELASAYSTAGGVYIFLKESFSPGVGFLWGWAMFWTMHTGIIAAIAMVFARYAAYFIPVGNLGLKLLAVGAIATLSAVNYLGVRQGSAIQTSFTIAKVTAIIAIIAVAFIVGPREPLATGVAATIDATHAASSAGMAHAFALALVASLFAFGGWHIVTYTAEETEEPEKTVPRALLIGVILVTACYVALNAAYFHVLPPTRIASSTRVAADAADAVLGTGGAAFMSALVAISTFGALNGVILAGPRVYMAMARDGMLFRWAGEIHLTFRTPYRAIVLQAAWATVLVVTGSYRSLFTRVVYTEWIFFALMAAGLMRLRSRSEYAPAYRLRGYPLIPLVFILSSLYIVTNQIISEPVNSVTGILLVAAGWPIYYFWLRKSRQPRSATADAD